MSAEVASSPAPDLPSSAPRRRSGRVAKKPERFADHASPTGSAKRKRGEANDSGSDDDAPSSDDEESESSAGEPDEEELRERRKQKKKRAATARKPPQKKPKTNGNIVGLALRPAAGVRKKAAPKARRAPIRKSALVDNDADGLYGRLHRY